MPGGRAIDRRACLQYSGYRSFPCHSGDRQAARSRASSDYGGSDYRRCRGAYLAYKFWRRHRSLARILGKDSTLTGRTYLWQRARDFIDQAPLLGTGYAAFWQIGNPPAEELWAASFEELGAGFNFHNLYLNTAVELGYVGLTSLILMLFTAGVRLLISIVKRPSPPVYFATAVFTFFCLTSFIEVALLYQFHLGTVLFGAIWAYSGNQALPAYGSALTPRKRMAMPMCIKPRRNHCRQADVNPAMPAATTAQAPAFAAERHALAGRDTRAGSCQDHFRVRPPGSQKSAGEPLERRALVWNRLGG